MGELNAQPEWRRYLLAVYGDDAAPRFPLELETFSFFYFNFLPFPWQRALLNRPFLNSKWLTVDRLTGKVPATNWYRVERDDDAPWAKDVAGVEMTELRRHGDWYIQFGGDGGVGRGAATAWRYLYRTIGESQQVPPPPIDGVAR